MRRAAQRESPPKALCGNSKHFAHFFPQHKAFVRGVCVMLVRVRVLKSNILLFFTERFPNHLSWGFEPLLLVAPSAPRVRTDTSNSTAVVLQASSRPRTRAFVYALGLGSHFAICSSKHTAVPMLYIAIYGSQQPGISQGSRALCSGEQYRGVRVVLRVGFSGMTKGWMGYRARWRSSHLSGAMEVNGPSKVPFRLPDKGRGHPCHLSNSSEPPQTHKSPENVRTRSAEALRRRPRRSAPGCASRSAQFFGFTARKEGVGAEHF